MSVRFFRGARPPIAQMGHVHGASVFGGEEPQTGSAIVSTMVVQSSSGRTVTFDPNSEGAGTTTYTPQSGREIFSTKLDENMNFVWNNVIRNSDVNNYNDYLAYSVSGRPKNNPSFLVGTRVQYDVTGIEYVNPDGVVVPSVNYVPADCPRLTPLIAKFSVETGKIEDDYVIKMSAAPASTNSHIQVTGMVGSPDEEHVFISGHIYRATSADALLSVDFGNGYVCEGPATYLPFWNAVVGFVIKLRVSDMTCQGFFEMAARGPGVSSSTNCRHLFPRLNVSENGEYLGIAARFNNTVSFDPVLFVDTKSADPLGPFRRTQLSNGASGFSAVRVNTENMEAEWAIEAPTSSDTTSTNYDCWTSAIAMDDDGGAYWSNFCPPNSGVLYTLARHTKTTGVGPYSSNPVVPGNGSNSAHVLTRVDADGNVLWQTKVDWASSQDADSTACVSVALYGDRVVYTFRTYNTTSLFTFPSGAKYPQWTAGTPWEMLVSVDRETGSVIAVEEVTQTNNAYNGAVGPFPFWSSGPNAGKFLYPRAVTYQNSLWRQYANRAEASEITTQIPLTTSTASRGGLSTTVYDKNRLAYSQKYYMVGHNSSTSVEYVNDAPGGVIAL